MYNPVAILGKHAFLSNAGDAALLADGAFPQAAGKADVRTILQTYGFVVEG